MNIRCEVPQDYREVENLTREAFWNVYRPGCSEHYILHRFRNDPDFIESLSFVLEEEDRIIGHIMYARAFVDSDDGQRIPIAVFGPISILPAYQGRGYGTELIRHSLTKASSMGIGAVAITGNPDYYQRFGFVSGSSMGIHHSAVPREEEAPFFMIKELTEGYLENITGTYKDPAGYQTDELDVDSFDIRFPPKEKRVLPGQLG
ncbi:MAG: N-acetyltransferase [Tissierellia bacterium]|nr:N-acetyltransferase [Tissierellia bacterium]